jgi:RND family efflux transporter MFP subunit
MDKILQKQIIEDECHEYGTAQSGAAALGSKGEPEEVEIAERRVAIARSQADQAKDGGIGTVNISMATLDLEVARMTLQQAERRLERLQLRAPMDGMVRLGQDLRVGQPVKAYAPVATVVNTEQLLIEANLATADMDRLQEGMALQFELNSLPGVLFAGQIVTLPQPYGRGTTPVVQILPQLDRQNNAFREGAAVTLRVEVGRKPGVLWLPPAAIQTIAGRSYVVVREEEQLRDQQVVLGLVGDGQTEILEGVSEGMVVVGP